RAAASSELSTFPTRRSSDLEGAKALGEVLVVGVNSDEQVRAQKGAGRPFMPERERAEMIASIRAVDFVTIFHEPTVEQLLRSIRDRKSTRLNSSHLGISYAV